MKVRLTPQAVACSTHTTTWCGMATCAAWVLSSGPPAFPRPCSEILTPLPPSPALWFIEPNREGRQVLLQTVSLLCLEREGCAKNSPSLWKVLPLVSREGASHSSLAQHSLQGYTPRCSAARTVVPSGAMGRCYSVWQCSCR